MVVVCAGLSLHAQEAVSAEPPLSEGGGVSEPVLRPNSVSGTVVDPDGRAIAGAQVRLVEVDSGKARLSTTGRDGWFDFEDVPAGRFRLETTAPGFAVSVTTDELRPGQILQLSTIRLSLGPVDFVVEAQALSTEELAEQQLHIEEQQRLLGVLPNFFVAYDWHAAPLNTRQKFALAFKQASDPASFFLTGAVAGVQQAENAYSGYGQGAQGYGKRYGADLADLWVGNYMGGAVLPSIFHQDPRYFYRGTGTVKSRFLYAVSRVLICRGDNGRWQPNYSGVLGDLSAGAISNVYYPASDRQGPRLTIENGFLGVAGDAMNGVVQEFILSHFTTKGKKDPKQP